MSYRVLSTRLKAVTSEAFAAAPSDSRAFSGLADALAWASRSSRGNFAVVVIEESHRHPPAVRTAEDAARSVL